MKTELAPLDGGEFRPELRKLQGRTFARRVSAHGNSHCTKTALRAFRLLLLCTILPALLIFVPMYLRYRVYSGQMYPVSMTDMRLIDNKISTTWCSTQVVRSNTTFNAFLVPSTPHISADLVPVRMMRTLLLQDDMKEYWGFYLLEGSVVTVSTCVRWPGASLTMIKGHKHLQQCAYIGDDSSEELEELLEANQLGLINNVTMLQRIATLLHDNSPANHPGDMKRHKGDVRFHDPSHVSDAPNTLVQRPAPSLDTPDVTDHDPQELREILERLHSRRRAIMEKKNQEKKKRYGVKYRPPAHLMALPELHRHRDTNVNREEIQWLSFNDIERNTTFQERTIETSELEQREMKSEVEQREMKSKVEQREMKSGENDTRIENGTNLREEEEENSNGMDDEMKPSSSEIYEGIMKQLQGLGDKGRRVLEKLSEGSTKIVSPTTAIPLMPDSTEVEAELKLKRLTKALSEALEDMSRKQLRTENRRQENEQTRVKRELHLERAKFQEALNTDDEHRNAALEEGQEDGIAEIHRVVNETTANDMSNSEFWSSFSSSEEALLECKGLILNLPLTPHPRCTAVSTDAEHDKAAEQNTVTYRVPTNGYYFFVFNSENEVQENLIRVKFQLQKTTYDVRRSVLECRNYTEKCDLPLSFFSSQKVVLEVPLRDDDSLWNEDFVVVSECVPRTSVYLACVIAVPLLVVLFAFQ